MKDTKRLCIYIIGTLLLVLGSVLFTRSQLGAASIVAVPYIISEISSLSLGLCTSIVYFVFVIGELFLYRKMKLIVLLQIPFAFVFGFLIDGCDAILKFQPNTLLLKIICLLLAILSTAIGIAMMLYGDYIINPPDGIVKALSQTLNKAFSRTKLLFDVVMVIFAVILEFLFTGRVVGVGIGTVIAALTIGYLIGIVSKRLSDF